MHKQAKKTSKWENYRAFIKECNRACRKAEWEYTNTIIEQGLAENNTKPFWKYIKPRKEENIGVSPLKSNGKLYSDSTTNAELLLRQFSSVFGKTNNTIMSTVKRRVKTTCPNLNITKEGVEKLLNNIKVSKAIGPDNIPNRLLQQCTREIAPSLRSATRNSSRTDSFSLPH